jgi:sphinganine-1-phosphate aldolase
MEAEVVQMCGKLFHGNEKVVGSITSGGTESIFMAVKVYRDWARQKNGTIYPEILVPETAHPAFDKAAQILDIRIRKVPVDKESFAVDVSKMRKMIRKSTCMVRGN